MPVLTIGIVRDCFYLLIFYSEKFSTWVWRLPFAVLENLSDKSQNQEILSTFSMPYACVSSFRPFFGQISLPFHKLQLVKSPPFYIREAWKWYPFLGGASLCGPVKGVRPLPPTDDFKARTDWILVSIYWFVHTCFALFASSARSSGSITDVLDLQTLQKENGSVLSVKTRWNNREEGDDINEPCSVFHRFAVNGGSCDLHYRLCRLCLTTLRVTRTRLVVSRVTKVVWPLLGTLAFGHSVTFQNIKLWERTHHKVLWDLSVKRIV